MKMELRLHNSELRSNQDGTMTVSGYVNKTGQLSNVLGVTKRFVEKISKGAFTKAIQNVDHDIDFLAEHNNKLILASTRNGSLQLREDEQGLFMSATIAPTSWGKDYYELINSGILRNMSFGFKTLSDSWRSIEAGLFERTIDELLLYEVSVVRDPAYSQSTIAARSIEIIDEPEVKIEEHEERRFPMDIVISKLELSITKQEEEVRRAEQSLRISPSSSVFKSVLKRENDKLSELNEELKQLKSQTEEKEMNNEERALTFTSDGGSVTPNPVDSIVVEKLESTSIAYAKARKIPFKGEELKVAYETSLDDAEFVVEGSDIPEINLNLNNFALLKQKRVGLSISLSKQLMLDSGVNLSQYVKNLLTRRVGKAIERSILSGTAENEFKGIAPDTSVVSSNFSATPVISDLRSVYLKVHEDFIPNGCWYMSRPFFEKVAVLEDGNGKYYVKNILVDGKVVPTLFGHPIEISNALADGNTIGQVPVLFGSIEDAYTIGVSSDLNIKPIDDAQHALAGSVGFVAEFFGDGEVTNYQAIAKGEVA